MMFIELFPGLFMKSSETDKDTLQKDMAAELRTADRIKGELAQLTGNALVNKTKELAECYGRVANIEKQLNTFKQIDAIKKGRSDV